MNFNLDTIDIIALSVIYGGLILLPVLNRKKPFPWKTFLWGFVIAAGMKILFYLINLLTLKLFDKPIGDTNWKPLNFFFVNVPLMILILLYMHYYGKSAKIASMEKKNS